MPRNMSFAATIEAFENRAKTQTRRKGWEFLRPGDILNGVEKSMGLAKGEKIVRLHQIRVTAVRREPLTSITDEDVKAEGFPGWSPTQFIAMYLKMNGGLPAQLTTVITFVHI